MFAKAACVPSSCEPLGLGRIPTVRGGWIRQAEADAGERDGRLTTDELEEPAQLRRERREMSRLRRVNEAQRTR
ncbi:MULTISPECIES: hypothetical protein [unclassified Streptomyces]|uniref:hypothetical protein n=1 Tax=unclassified Streptomyces TaxID=2593676 RepID=UPI002E7FCBA0|nr:hypothetical protein [Streptomyces sp. NBC_00562]WTC76855.1 hypothetical protein OH719_02015 [Streptomyces sp. NBC_01653]WTD30934.1 hypothetical protein OHB03_00880 [Streptomyces sp. NBC_01643]WTD86518.1 hypothetical protein OG891_02015 [Streptomyces sp. NBC_01637]WTC84347.1 hypothetical protein OH719_44850 [Streptomyces sp. NBC_01653]WTD38728.1 hypothetical protein OHB03_45390 [Streptomyces sp. NBC_01643]